MNDRKIEVLTADDGSIYEGQCLDGKPHGKGTVKKPTGDAEEGFWVKGKRNGKCVLKRANGIIIEGDFVEGLLHGTRTVRYTTGSVYTSEWIKGKQHGKEIRKNADGSTAEFEWRDGKRNGKEIIKYTDHSISECEWVNDEKHGKEIIRYADGSTREYEWVNGKKHGLEVAKSVDGEISVYEWVDGEQVEAGFSLGIDGSSDISKQAFSIVEDADLIDMTESQFRLLLPTIDEALTMRIGAEISNRLPQSQLLEFDALGDDQAEEWLTEHCPEYKGVVLEIISSMTAKLKSWKTPYPSDAFKLGGISPLHTHELLYRGDRMLKRHKPQEALSFHLWAQSLLEAYPAEWEVEFQNHLSALVYNSICLDYIALHNNRSALSAALKAKELLMKHGSEDNEALSVCFDSLFYLYASTGDLEKSFESAKLALEYAEKQLSVSIREEILNDLLNIICNKVLAFDDRLRFVFGLLDGQSVEDGKSYKYEVASKLMAELYSEAGDSEKAVKYALHYAEIKKTQNGEKHISTAEAYLYVATCCANSFGRNGCESTLFEIAISCAEKAAKLFQVEGDIYHKGVSLSVMGELYKSTNSSDAETGTHSIKRRIDTLSADEQTNAPQSHTSVDFDSVLPQAVEAVYSYDMMAIDYAKLMMAQLANVYENVIRLPQEQLRLSYLRTMKKSINMCYVIAAQYPDDFSPVELYDFALKTSNVDSEIAFTLSRFYKTVASPEIKASKDALDSMRQERAQKLTSGKEDAVGIASYDRKIENLEVKLLGLLSDVKIEDPIGIISARNIRNSLAQNEALIEFVHIPIFNNILTKMKNSASKSEEVCAFPALIVPEVLFEDESVDYYCVFLLKHAKLVVKFITIPQIVSNISDRISHGKDCDDLLIRAYNALISPFSESLEGIEKLYIVPDGSLYRIPFEMLTDPAGKNLYETVNSIIYLSSGRELLRTYQRPVGDAISVIANPQYELDAKAFALVNEEQVQEHHKRSVDMETSLDWKRISALPFTEIEAGEAASLFNRVSLDTWSLATKHSLYNSGTSDVLHIATHGFYFDQQTRGLLLENLAEERTIKQDEDYLLRFGLLFSGVRNWLRGEYIPETFGDGIINGCDLLDMDLSKYKLLVLSACQTGRGDTRSGEGIKGLRHSFELAGVGSIISTLWDVDDCASALLMYKFYDELLLDPDIDLSLALKRAKEYVRTISGAELANMNWSERLKQLYISEQSEANPELKLNYKTALTALHRLTSQAHPFEHPMYWAAFVLQGHQKSLSTSTHNATFGERYYDGQFSGESEYVFANGNIYIGWWRNGKMHGKGKLTYINGSIYDGEFVNGQRSGKGVYLSCDGERFDGTWLKNRRHGFGFLTLINGDTYEGAFENSQFSGYGIYKTKPGDVYAGDWLNGKRHGKGKYSYASGDVYEGTWSEGLPHGTGIQSLASGETYSGEFCRGQRTGKGTCKYTDMRVYEGEWLNGEWNGLGTLVFANNDVYSGTFEAGQFVLGVYRLNDGSTYEGAFSSGKLNGHGIYTNPDGGIYEGEWLNGKRHGVGKSRVV